MKAILRFKAEGPGRGWWGPPKGTHTARSTGGSKIKISGTASPAQKARVQKLLDAVPDWAVKQSRLHVVEVYTERGRYNKVGGGYAIGHSQGSVVSLYDIENQGEAQLQRTIAHEIGHGLQRTWFSSSNVTALEAKEDFMFSWYKGEDGITPYSAAWARHGVHSETVAEMSSLYFTKGKSAFLARCRELNASGLGQAFVDGMDALEGEP